MIKPSILKSTTALALYGFSLITLAVIAILIYMHSNSLMGNQIIGISFKKTTPHMGLSPSLIIIEDAHQFDAKAKSISDLVSSGNLMKVPKDIIPIAGSIQLIPTGLLINNMDENECRSTSDHGTEPEDQGIEGAQCIHIDKTKDYAVVFRERPIPSDMKGWWVWHAIREQKRGADRIKLISETSLAPQCSGVIVPKGGKIEINKTIDFCLPAFEGEETKKTRWGPFYSSEPRAQLVIHAGGGQYTLEMNFD